MLFDEVVVFSAEPGLDTTKSIYKNYSSLSSATRSGYKLGFLANYSLSLLSVVKASSIITSIME